MARIERQLVRQYIKLITNNNDGWISVGHRVGTDKRTFKPDWIKASHVVEWAAKLPHGSHIFINPVLRRSHTAPCMADSGGCGRWRCGAGKGGARRAVVAWADYDSDGRGAVKIPATLVPHAWRVRSGRPDNVHLYLKLTEGGVGWRDLTLINYLLYKVTGSDAKWSDESLLRLPGSVNAKVECGSGGSAVVPEVPWERVVPITPVDAIRRLSVALGVPRGDLTSLRDRVCRGGTTQGGCGTDFVLVDVPAEKLAGLPHSARTALAIGSMPTRGNRSNSRAGFWKDFWRAGLTIDETYSLMVKSGLMDNVFDWESDLDRLWSKYENGAF